MTWRNSGWRDWRLTAISLVLVGSPAVTAPASAHANPSVAAASARGATDSAEMALALSAAPATLTTGAEVYVWHDGHFVKARTGSSGVACMVSRDARMSGVFPMCFDPEAARTQMPEEMMKTELKARGLSDSAIQRQVDAAFASGTLHHPTKAAITYMMSSHQVLVTSQAEGSKRIGAWRPHVMIYLPHAATGQFALGAEEESGPVSAPFVDAGGVQLVVQVPHWADSGASPEGSVR